MDTVLLLGMVEVKGGSASDTGESCLYPCSSSTEAYNTAVKLRHRAGPASPGCKLGDSGQARCLRNTVTDNSKPRAHQTRGFVHVSNGSKKLAVVSEPTGRFSRKQHAGPAGRVSPSQFLEPSNRSQLLSLR